MKKFNKTLIAAALMLGAGAANAAIDTTLAGQNDLFLVVYDPLAINADGTSGRTYNLDTNIKFDSLVANAATALSAFTSGFNLAADSLWTQFVGTGANALTSSARFGLFVGNTLDVFTTGNSFGPNAALQNVNLGLDVNAINGHANEINTGLAAPAGAGYSSTANSLLIQDSVLSANSNVATGEALGNFNSTWGGWVGDPTGALGTTPLKFSFGSHSVVAGRSGNVDVFVSTRS